MKYFVIIYGFCGLHCDPQPIRIEVPTLAECERVMDLPHADSLMVACETVKEQGNGG